MEIDIWPTAFRHGVNESDILHALRNPLKGIVGANEMYLIIGGAQDGRVLEIGFGDTGAVVHVMTARRKYWP